MNKETLNIAISNAIDNIPDEGKCAIIITKHPDDDWDVKVNIINSEECDSNQTIFANINDFKEGDIVKNTEDGAIIKIAYISDTGEVHFSAFKRNKFSRVQEEPYMLYYKTISECIHASEEEKKEFEKWLDDRLSK